VEFLGVIISLKGVKIQKEKVKEILKWPIPRSIKEIQKFLGLANYYRHFIKNFTKVAALLHLLVKKKEK